VLWARLGWLADPATAPDWARAAAESAHAAASNRAAQARDVIDGEVVTPGTAPGASAGRPAGRGATAPSADARRRAAAAGFPARARPTVPPRTPAPSAGPALQPPSRPARGR
jgi:hypothetical protein